MPPLTKAENDRVLEMSDRAPRVRERAHFRPTADQKEIYVRAASIMGQSLSEFMRAALDERANRVIAEHERLILNNEARKTFLAALENPAPPNDRLAALAERYAREVNSRP